MSHREFIDVERLPAPVNERPRFGQPRLFGVRLSPKRILSFVAIVTVLYLFLSRSSSNDASRTQSGAQIAISKPALEVHEESTQTSSHPNPPPIAEPPPETDTQKADEPLPEPAHHKVPYRPVHPLDFTLPDLSTFPSDSILTFIPYTFGYPMLIQTLEIYAHASWPNIIVIDNSWHRDAFNSEPELKEKYGVLKVVLTPSHLQFSALMSMIDTLGAASGFDKYMWTHSDAALISESAHPFNMVKECIEKAWKKDESLGVLFFAYDLLSMVKVEAGQHAPWDTTLPQYGADCDRYARIRMAGYKTPDAPELCDLPSIKFFNMNTVLSSRDLELILSPHAETPFSYRVETIQQANKDARFHEWRLPNDRSGISRFDKEIQEAHRRGGSVHFMHKWGGKKCGLGMPCNIKDSEKAPYDTPVVPIKPSRNG